MTESDMPEPYDAAKNLRHTTREQYLELLYRPVTVHKMYRPKQKSFLIFIPEKGREKKIKQQHTHKKIRKIRST